MKFLMDSEEYSLATQFGKSNCFTIVFHSSVVQKVIMYINDRDFFFNLNYTGILLRLILNYDMVLALLLKKIRCKIWCQIMRLVVVDIQVKYMCCVFINWGSVL